MLSLIICSRKATISNELKNNIDLTIGVTYELVIINNSSNRFNIFSAYNEGVKRAKYMHLCFMHEDILFHTINWGRKVLKYFDNPEIGLIGIAGTHYLPKAPCGWYQSMIVSGATYSEVNGSNKLKKEDLQTFDYSHKKHSIEAVAVDGLWFCIPKEQFNYISFDNKTFSNYHCYDLDICMQIKLRKYQIYIVFDIQIEHFSPGKYGKIWADETLKFYNKWESFLPQIAGIELSIKEIETRREMVNEIFYWMNISGYYEFELDNLRKSYSYRIGKILISPISKLNKLLKIKM